MNVRVYHAEAIKDGVVQKQVGQKQLSSSLAGRGPHSPEVAGLNPGSTA